MAVGLANDSSVVMTVLTMTMRENEVLHQEKKKRHKGTTQKGKGNDNLTVDPDVRFNYLGFPQGRSLTRRP